MTWAAQASPARVKQILKSFMRILGDEMLTMKPYKQLTS